MRKKYAMIIGMVLLTAAICFIGYTFGHPESGLPWSNRITFLLYGAYIWLIFEFLLDIPSLKNKRKQTAKFHFAKAVMCFAVAVIFLLMEVTGSKVDIYTVVRGFIVVCGMEMGIKNILCWAKNRG